MPSFDFVKCNTYVYLCLETDGQWRLLHSIVKGPGSSFLRCELNNFIRLSTLTLKLDDIFNRP